MEFLLPQPSCCSFIPNYVFEGVAKAEQDSSDGASIATQAIQMKEDVQKTHIHDIDNLLRVLFGQPSPKEKSAKQVHRKVYTLSNKLSKNIGDARLVRDEGQQASNDEAADKCYEFLGDAFRFFSEVFERDSIDDKGLTLVGVTHYGTHFPNAVWDNRLKVMWLGDGFQRNSESPATPAPKFEGYFGNFYNSVEIIGHELMHGVTNIVAGLDYYGETGALNEHLSDAFGLMIKHYKLQQTAEESDWLLGQDLILPGLNNMAMRSFKDPGNAYVLPENAGHDMQVHHMGALDMKKTLIDNGGVHIFSGIPNHAFYLAAMKIGGYTWERLGKIWWKTLNDGHLDKYCTFADFASKTVAFAREYGNEVESAVLNGWRMTGVLAEPDRASS